MMREPWFWRERTLAARAAAGLLAPAAALYDAGQRLRAARARPAKPPLPVFCVGAATLGGVGKTPFALLLAETLKRLGERPHFLTRGYGGGRAGPLQVDPSVHDARAVGDEALLLARAAPVWIARARPRGAAAAFLAGASALVMDDGFQNPSLEKTLSFLIVDAADPAGNGRIFPAGPLREPLARAAARADAIVIAGVEPDGAGPSISDGEGKPRFRVRLEPRERPAPRRALAFCGVGRPERFFALLETQGFELAARRPFPDHHPFTEAEIGALRREAKRLGAALVTTEKDFVRLPPAWREDVAVLPVAMRIDDPAGLERLAKKALAAFHAPDTEKA
ncbi:tetraacyldisaccharide 4'-kinase [Amphiplicatus metriothermophilus]|uniref:Tetraacyldisaccharide 4'-kinase n=1 Tax=Amphiplicatus metriothermophilus TaxID=1519374 RepID=A0A239PSC7_9PROT|nr:tetraacyldisaccharide 4'-kinase [Amphiplicatus metriothermophilus]MBB5519105.1 tetraacyldisaccharide 4'-kinase [Amphiplicatus metriothermophilus]SNT73175.1 lipid-A-disaccharide kinase [Amphiplicatus metriothermophilus]